MSIDMLVQLPEGLEKYSETPLFTEKSVPDKITNEHRTKPGVWGKLIVFDGGLDYVIPGPPEARQHIKAGEFGVIEPEIIHFVDITGSVAFKVEFYKSAG